MMDLIDIFSQLSSELLLLTDSDNATFLSKLLEHSSMKEQSDDACAGILAYYPELMTVITLDTATRWLDASVERSAALLSIRSFSEHVMDMVKDRATTSSCLDKPRFSVLQSGLEVLLRMCMNSEACCQATLGSEVSSAFPQLINSGGEPVYAGLAAAILTVCFIKAPTSSAAAALVAPVMAAVVAFFRTLNDRWAAGAAVDADAFYMAAALLQICKRFDPEQWHARLSAENLPELLTQMAPVLAAAQHNLALSSALSLLQPFVVGNFHAKLQLLENGIMNLVLELLTNVSVQERASNGVKAHNAARSRLDQLEMILAALAIVIACVDDCRPGVSRVVEAHPCFFLQTLLRLDNPLVLCKTCDLIVILADENPDMQRLFRVEGVLEYVVAVLDVHACVIAERINVFRRDDLQSAVEVVTATGVALCAMLNGSPDNHMYMAATDNVQKVTNALSTMATMPRSRQDPELSEFVDAACAELVTALSVLSRNMANRTMLASSGSLDAMADTLVSCQNSRAQMEVMYVLVLLVSKDSNAARHLVERQDFMPMLFSLIQQGPSFVALENASALVLVLVRDCKMNKSMLMKSGIPAIISTLQQHADPGVSSTTVQALSGVLTLLAMSRTMLEMVVKLGGLSLLVEMLQYSAPAAELEDASSSADAASRATSVQEAACVLLGCLSDASSKARAKILQCDGVIPRLIQKVVSVQEVEVQALLSGASRRVSQNGQHAVAAESDEPSSRQQIAEVASNSSQQALIATLAQLMQNSGPDNFVFQAAMQAMQKLDGAAFPKPAHGRALGEMRSFRAGGDGDSEWDAASTRHEGGDQEEERYETTRVSGARGHTALIPVDAKLQLALAAINALFSLMNSKHDQMDLVWPHGGPELIRRLLMLGRKLKDSFEEEATKLLVVLLSNPKIQTAARECGLVVEMVHMTMESDSVSMLIATKALAVVCRNSIANQVQALEHGLLDKCLDALSSGMDIYSAKWVILVINALVYDNAQAQSVIMKRNAVPLLVKWLDAGPEHEVATAAARALAKSAKGNAAIQRAICDAGGVPAFVAMLDGKPFSLAVRAAAEALSDIAKDNVYCQDQIREAGTFRKLFTLMKSMQSTSLVVTVTRTFAVLAHGNVANMDAIHALDCMPTLIDMLAPEVGPIINAAAADLLRVLCSHRDCQLSVITNNGIQALLRSLRENTFAAAQSAAVWSLNAVVQGQKSTLPTFMEPDVLDTLMNCIASANGAAAGTVRLLLVMFLHSGRHDELCAVMERNPAVLRALLDMIRAGPETEPTKWAASLLSTLCWQEDAIKRHMVMLRAPGVLAGTLVQTVDILSGHPRSPSTVRTVIESTISSVQALISLTDTSVRSAVGGELSQQALGSDCIRLLCKSALCCVPALLQIQEPSEALSHQLDKLLKPHLIALEYLIADHIPDELSAVVDMILSTPCVPDETAKHALSMKTKLGKA